MPNRAAQFVVATVNSLEGYPIDDYAYRLGRAWKIGAAKNNDGVMLLVAPKEHKVWIATGYGAGVFLTDAMSGVIIRKNILPHFKQNPPDYGGGIEAGADAIIKQMSLPPDEAQKNLATAQQAQEHRQHSGGSALPVIFWVMVFGFAALSHFRRGRGRRYRTRSGGISPWVVLWGLNELDRGSRGGWGGGDRRGAVVDSAAEEAAAAAASPAAEGRSAAAALGAAGDPPNRRRPREGRGRDRQGREHDRWRDRRRRDSDQRRLSRCCAPLGAGSAVRGARLGSVATDRAGLVVRFPVRRMAPDPTMSQLLTLLMVFAALKFTVALLILKWMPLRLFLTPAATKHRRVRRRAIAIFKAAAIGGRRDAPESSFTCHSPSGGRRSSPTKQS